MQCTVCSKVMITMSYDGSVSIDSVETPSLHMQHFCLGKKTFFECMRALHTRSNIMRMRKCTPCRR